MFFPPCTQYGDLNYRLLNTAKRFNHAYKPISELSTKYFKGETHCLLQERFYELTYIEINSILRDGLILHNTLTSEQKELFMDGLSCLMQGLYLT